MPCTLFNVGRLSRVSHRDGREGVHLTLTSGMVLASTDWFARLSCSGERHLEQERLHAGALKSNANLRLQRSNRQKTLFTLVFAAARLCSGERQVIQCETSWQVERLPFYTAGGKRLWRC